MSENKSEKSPIAKATGTIGFIMVLLVVILLAPTVILPMTGIQLYNVVTGSMEPEIPVNSLVCVSSVDARTLAEGDIITFKSGGLSRSAVVTHRVVENDIPNERITTKGDANNSTDPNPISYEYVIGKVSWHAPVIGGIYGFFGTIPGRIVGLVGILIGVLLFFIEGILDKKKK